MRVEAKNPFVPAFLTASKVCIFLIAVISISVLVGWSYNIPFLKSISSNAVPLGPNAAVAFILISLALALGHYKHAQWTPTINLAINIISGLILLLGVLSLIENISNRNLIDTLLYASKFTVITEGRIAPIKAVGFILIGLAIFMLNSKPVISQIIACIVGMLGLLIIVGFTLHISATSELYLLTYASLNTPLLLMLVSLAILFSNPDKGIMTIIASNTVGGEIARYLLLAAITFPLAIRYLSYVLENYHLYDMITGIVLTSLLTTIIAGILVLYFTEKMIKHEIERKETETIRRIYLNKIELANTELEQFAYVASHDLQEPLRMVSSYVQLLEQRYKDKLDQNANDFIHFASDGAKRMQTLINELLTYYRSGRQTKIVPIDCNELINFVLQDFELSIHEKNAIIKVGDLPVVNADRMQLSQVFHNLISNALKFNDGVPHIYIDASEDNESYYITIKDNGIGIPKESLNKIFVILSRINPNEKYPGSGIGLAICKKVIENHMGKMWVTSELDKGSTFHFSLPKEALI